MQLPQNSSGGMHGPHSLRHFRWPAEPQTVTHGEGLALVVETVLLRGRFGHLFRHVAAVQRIALGGQRLGIAAGQDDLAVGQGRVRILRPLAGGIATGGQGRDQDEQQTRNQAVHSSHGATSMMLLKPPYPSSSLLGLAGSWIQSPSTMNL